MNKSNTIETIVAFAGIDYHKKFSVVALEADGQPA
jgi:hypothetical protein